MLPLYVVCLFRTPEIGFSWFTQIASPLPRNVSLATFLRK